jgi:hypothetical protein
VREPKFGPVLAGTALLSIVALAGSAVSQPYYGDTPYGPAMMGPYGMGPWMMNPGMVGPGMMGGAIGGPGMMLGWGLRQPDLNLSLNDVKGYFERWLVIAGNPRVKLGQVTEMDANTVTVDIVTTDREGLVQRYSVDRHTGVFRPA